MLKRGIKQKLVISLVITSLLIISLFIALLDRYLREYSTNEANKSIEFLGQNTVQLLQKPLFNFDYNQLKSIVQPIILKEFDYLVVVDNSTLNIAFQKDDKGITEGFDWEELLKGKSKVERTDRQLQTGTFTQFLFPISMRGVSTPLGYLIIGVSQSKMKSRLAGFTYRIVVVSFMLFLALTITIYYLSDKIVKPIKALSNDIGKFASGNLSVRSDIDTKDEIGNLSYNFNFMADKINEQIVSIEKYSKDLEKMVEERTTELLKALDAIKEKDNRLNQAEKIKSLNAIVSSIAHEINNPMAIISGNLQLITARMTGTSEFKILKKLEAAQLAVDRISTLIDEINFFTALKDADTFEISFRSVLDSAVEKTIPATIPIVIDGSRIKGSEDKIHSDQHLLTITLESVLKNSVQMITHRKIEKGKIQVTYYIDFPDFLVEISDNAGGIDEPEKVFDPFYTTFNEKKGLGLTFVYHAVQALNGDVTVANILNDHTHERGARVTIKLPIPFEPEEEVVEDPPWQP